MHEHTTHIDRHNNILCHCGKIFVRNFSNKKFRMWDNDRDI